MDAEKSRVWVLSVGSGTLSSVVMPDQVLKKKDAIICASDLMAIGAMKALTDMDIFRPVCGFDGISLMGYAGKQMHTVKQDFRQIAAGAVDEMSRLLAGGVGQEIIMPHKLIRMEYKDVIS